LFERLQNTVIALVLVISIGLHWPLLQSVAWLNMIVSYSKVCGFEQAVAKTFSGKHPCKLCKLVDAGKKAEKKQSKEIVLKKFDLLPYSHATIFFPPRIIHDRTTVCFSVESLHYPPLNPPPDGA
jgi:hypothetical protein